MSTEVKIPSLGVGLTEAKLVEWLVADGTKIASGEAIYSVETEKSVQDIEAPAAGVLKILKTGDETYPVGEVIGVIE